MLNNERLNFLMPILDTFENHDIKTINYRDDSDAIEKLLMLFNIVYPHCSAIALAMPGNVLLLAFARSS